MTFDEAADEMMLILGNRTDTAMRDKCKTAIQRAQRYLEKNWISRPLPWFMLSERSDSTTAGDEERVELPDDFVEEYENDGLWVIDDNGGEHLLKKFDADTLREVQQQRTDYGTITGLDPLDIPTQYALTGKYFRLFPAPNRVLSVRMMYYRTLDLPSLGSDENEWLNNAPYAVIGWAGERLATGIRDQTAVQMFSQWKQGGIAALDIKTTERDLANRRMQMGETL
jgi:hypothetical protein